jgi:hypothetical protein
MAILFYNHWYKNCINKFTFDILTGDKLLHSFFISSVFFLRHRVQTGSGAHPASYERDTEGSFPGGIAIWV